MSGLLCLKLIVHFVSHSDLKECIEKATAVQHTMDLLRRSDDYTLLQRATLTIDEIEGVFVNPPQCTPRSVHCPLLSYLMHSLFC